MLLRDTHAAPHPARTKLATFRGVKKILEPPRAAPPFASCLELPSPLARDDALSDDEPRCASLPSSPASTKLATIRLARLHRLAHIMLLRDTHAAPHPARTKLATFRGVKKILEPPRAAPPFASCLELPSPLARDDALSDDEPRTARALACLSSFVWNTRCAASNPYKAYGTAPARLARLHRLAHIMLLRDTHAAPHPARTKLATFRGVKKILEPPRAAPPFASCLELPSPLARDDALSDDEPRCASLPSSPGLSRRGSLERAPAPSTSRRRASCESGIFSVANEELCAAHPAACCRGAVCPCSLMGCHRCWWWARLPTESEPERSLESSSTDEDRAGRVRVCSACLAAYDRLLLRRRALDDSALGAAACSLRSLDELDDAPADTHGEQGTKTYTAGQKHPDFRKDRSFCTSGHTSCGACLAAYDRLLLRRRALDDSALGAAACSLRSLDELDDAPADTHGEQSILSIWGLTPQKRYFASGCYRSACLAAYDRLLLRRRALDDSALGAAACSLRSLDELDDAPADTHGEQTYWSACRREAESLSPFLCGRASWSRGSSEDSCHVLARCCCRPPAPRTASVYTDSSDDVASLAGSDSLYADERLPRHVRSAQISKIVEYFERKGADFTCERSFGRSRFKMKDRECTVDVKHRTRPDIAEEGCGRRCVAQQRLMICEGAVKSKLPLFDRKS
ncbi:uncharacterized protein LOC135071303 [Ostrinia nubilalis]|uniref:uncharacterized protein LOC135071303 n=1 Tax=Ostrinia nubilalis TaxID=29057 RepID=UPI0030822561